eukprot:TRINITY_DN1822_c0_g1_i1.p1 TRINITY_DN1822_c0_g1~~TRINITY_DN1822_c0_g1_i1.p1  ORF type:complete len:398 (+),score=95.61 TRINITY_DN1822_c0_g1_i1:1-1194(+)
MIQNLETFDKKTTFAQAKYIKRKQKKHRTLVQILKPTTKTLTETYHFKSPKKIYRLSHEYIGKILAEAHIFPGKRVIIVESTSGLLTGACLSQILPSSLDQSRIENYLNEELKRDNEQNNSLTYHNDKRYCYSVLFGSIVQVFVQQDKPTSHILGCYNYTKEIMNNVILPVSFPLLPLILLDQPTIPLFKNFDNYQNKKYNEKYNNNDNDDENSMDIVNSSNSLNNNNENNNNSISSNDDDDNAEMNDSDNDNEEKKKVGFYKTEKKSFPDNDYQMSLRRILSHGSDTLIIATKKSVSLVLKEMFPFLSFGGKLVIYSIYLNEIKQCSEMLIESKKVIDLDVFSITARNFQVLPERTHPFFEVENSSGYVLSATKVYDLNNCLKNPTTKRKKKKKKI